MPIRRARDHVEQRQALARLLTGGLTISESQYASMDRRFRGNQPDGREWWACFDGDGRPGPVALLVYRTGRSAILFTSCVRRRREIDALASVVDTAVGAVDTARATLVQAMLDPGEELQAEALRSAGLVDLATLHYMQRTVSRADMPDPPAGFELEPYREAARDDFLIALEASYERTQDCPMLRGMRRTEDVLEGHRAAGRFDPALWTLVRREGRPVGLLLLSHVPEHACVELVYLGLAVEARGCGLGAHLVRRAIAQCGQAGERTLALAVDQSNRPAMALYRREGFYRVARKYALVKNLLPSR